MICLNILTLVTNIIVSKTFLIRPKRLKKICFSMFHRLLKPFLRTEWKINLLPLEQYNNVYD